jgi:hypothetical protein
MLSQTENTPSFPPQRRAIRIELTLPVRVEGCDGLESVWSEVTRFQTISNMGAGFSMQRQLRPGQMILLTSPIPQTLRHFDHHEPRYRIWSLVRYSNPCKEGFNTGVAFYGKHAPNSFLENPSRTYDLVGFEGEGLIQIREQVETHSVATEIGEPPKTAPKHSRYLIPVEVILEISDASGRVINRETTVSENISVGGASVFATSDVNVGDFVRVTFPVFDTSIMARIRNRRVGDDKMPRLHLEFVDRQLTLEGIE